MSLIKPSKYKWMQPLLALLLVLAGCGTPDALGSQAEQPSGTILFAANGHIFSWDGHVHQITTSGQDTSPRWAPSGDRFAYVSVNDVEGYSDLIIANANGDTLRQVTNNRPDGQPGSPQFARYAYWAQDPDWSPTGDHLVYLSDKGGWEPGPNEERYSDPMFLWYADTSEAEPYILPGSAALGSTQEWPTFSPDGTHVAFVARTSGDATGYQTEILSMDLNGGKTTSLVSSDQEGYEPDWSPDGKNLAVIQRKNTQNDIWIVPVDGGGSCALTDVGNCAAPIWSPDGHFLAFFRVSGSGSIDAWYVALSYRSDGQISASKPHKLFSADGIDTVSGMSWAVR